MKVIEHDSYRLAVRDQAVHQLIDGRLDRGTPDAEAHQRPTPQTVAEPLDGRRQVRPQSHRIVVARIERHPNDGLRALDTPRPQERRLAVADRRVDHRQRGAGDRDRASQAGVPCAASRGEPGAASAWARSPAAVDGTISAFRTLIPIPQSHAMMRRGAGQSAAAAQGE